MMPLWFLILLKLNAAARYVFLSEYTQFLIPCTSFSRDKYLRASLVFKYFHYTNTHKLIQEY